MFLTFIELVVGNFNCLRFITYDYCSYKALICLMYESHLVDRHEYSKVILKDKI